MQSNSLNNDLFLSYWDAIANPNPGFEATIPIPGPAQSELVLLVFTLVTDANVDDRIVWISLESGGTTIPFGSSAFAHPANTTYNYICHQNAVTNAAGNIRDLMIPLPFIRLFSPSENLKINITDKNLTDQLSEIRAYWKTWRGVSS